MKTKLFLKVLGGTILAALSLGVFGSMASGDPGGLKFEVTVTNLTRGQTFTPILVASHKAGVKVFTLGDPASVALEVLAEDGDTGPLATLLLSMPGVHAVADSGGLLPPGGLVTVEVSTTSQFDHVSVASMLIPTNDAFFALNGVTGPTGNKMVMRVSPAYDAGTEANDEDCLSIPGPFCMGAGFDPSRAGAEGFVHVHAGIHGGVGGVDPTMHDWRNPVAQITIKRIP